MVFETVLLSHLQVHGLGEEVYPDGGLVGVVEAVVHKPEGGHLRTYLSYVAIQGSKRDSVEGSAVDWSI